MKQLFILLLIPVLALSLTAKSSMKFEKNTFDFGEIEAGKVVSIEFSFENTGDEKLIIKNINSSCGCTAAQPEKLEYAPGEKGTLKVNFNSQGQMGQIVKSISITTNDPENPYSRLEIKGNVKITQFAELEFDQNSENVNFQTVKLNSTTTKKITIKNAGTIPLEIKEVCAYAELYVLFPKNPIRPGEKIELKIVFNAWKKGSYSNFIKIHTNSMRQRLFIVKVTAEVE